MGQGDWAQSGAGQNARVELVWINHVTFITYISVVVCWEGEVVGDDPATEVVGVVCAAVVVVDSTVEVVEVVTGPVDDAAAVVVAVSWVDDTAEDETTAVDEVDDVAATEVVAWVEAAAVDEVDDEAATDVVGMVCWVEDTAVVETDVVVGVVVTIVALVEMAVVRV